MSFDRDTEKSSGEISWWLVLERDLVHFTLRVRGKGERPEYPTTLAFHRVDARTRVELQVMFVETDSPPIGRGSARLTIDGALVLDAPDAKAVSSVLGFFHAVQRMRAGLAG